MSAHAEIRAIVHHEDGAYWAEVPECPGLFASGESLDELAEAIAEAWAMWHDDDNRPLDLPEGNLELRPQHEVSALHVRVGVLA